MRTFVAERARQAGPDRQSAAAIMRALNEIAASSLRHGGGHGELRTWSDSHSLVCECPTTATSAHRQLATLRPPLVPRPEPAWLASQLCDLVQIYSAGRAAIRLSRNL